MEQSKDKMKNILLYISDVASLLVSYILSGWLWLVIYKGFANEYVVGDKLGFEIGAMILSYAFVVIFFNANHNFFKRDKLNELLNVIKTNLMFASLFVVILFAGDSLKSSIFGLNAKPIIATHGFLWFSNSNFSIAFCTFSAHQKDL